MDHNSTAVLSGGTKDALPQSLIDFVTLAARPDGSQPPRKRQRVSEKVKLQPLIPLRRLGLEVRFTSKCVSENSERQVLLCPGSTLCFRSPGKVEITEQQSVQGKKLLRLDIRWNQPYSARQSPKTLHVLGTCVVPDDHSTADNSRVEEIQRVLSVYDAGKSAQSSVGILFKLSQRDGFDHLEILFEVQWLNEGLLRHAKSWDQSYLDDVVRETYLRADHGKARAHAENSRTAKSFYDSVYVPPLNDNVANNITTDGIKTDLYPFQKRSLAWMLKREASPLMGVIEPNDDLECIRDSFEERLDADGKAFFYSPMFNVATRDLWQLFLTMESIKGGILAEEMGLGKTVEMAALITLHKAPSHRPLLMHVQGFEPVVRQTSATLIITPPSILKQWVSELEKHAPSLSVFEYPGMKGSKISNDDWLDKLNSYDVVLTTYRVLAAEIHYAVPPPDRATRSGQSRHERPQSPLVRLSWWRVCLDEVQMIESGVSNAARVAQMIPRVNAWGVSGTPVRRDISDLYGLLFFLRCEPFYSNKNFFEHLVNHPKYFKKYFNQLALRHSKQQVRNELRLPPQKRIVISMPFTPIEEQHYRSLFIELAERCGLNATGNPLDDDWDPYSPRTIEYMRQALIRLRQTALHPEVGGRNRRALGRPNGQLRTVDDVLNTMLDQSDATIRADERTVLISKLKRGQFLENGPRVKEALAIWTEGVKEATILVDEAREFLEQAKSKDPEAENAVDSSSESEKDTEKDENSRLGTLRNRLRSALEVQHMAVFFQANAYFQIKSNEEMTKPDSEDFKALEELETAGYERAKKIRQEILQEIFGKASHLMRKVARNASQQTFVEIPELSAKKPARGGLETSRIIERLDNLAEALDAQANELDEWREQTIQFLLKPLVDEDDGVDITGDEYENSTKTQDEVMVYVQALRAVIADRYDNITGQENLLIKNEVKTSLKLAREGGGAFPEKIIELLRARAQIKPHPDLGSLSGILADLRNLATTLRVDAENGSKRAENELVLVEKERAKASKQLTEQRKAVAALEQEIDLFTTVMNTRVEYYRQLQQVSDMVAPFEGEITPNAHLPMIAKEDALLRRIAAAKAKRRYLVHLQDEALDQSAQRMCVVCQETFEVGALTVCGHQYCKECMMAWWHQHRTCPICKRRLTRDDLHDITYKPQELQVHNETPSLPASPGQDQSNKTSIYSEISAATLSQIKNVELDGPSYGTKINTLARHILWLRETDPGAKSIIFSQYKDFLDVLGGALKRFRIGYATIDKAGSTEKFKKDAGIEVFLLHARAQSSGLNLVVASHVFLCEPLINTALELQAIARVDRIGQFSATTVWLYLIQDSVEESIYDITVRRRLEHMGKGVRGTVHGEEVENANSKELQAKPLASLLAKGGGEVVDREDLWGCLFGNAKKRDRGGPAHPVIARELGASAAEERARG